MKRVSCVLMNPRRKITPAEVVPARALLGSLCLALLSLSLLLGGPGHLAFHGSENHCGSHHAEHVHHGGGFDDCRSALLVGAHDCGSVDAHHAHTGAHPSESHQGDHKNESPVSLKLGRFHSGHDCIHCFQVAGETPEVSISLSGSYLDGRVCLALHREVFYEGSFDVPNPRGPPSAA